MMDVLSLLAGSLRLHMKTRVVCSRNYHLSDLQ
jgi:hypothetical protein